VNRRAFAIVGRAVHGNGAKCIGLARTARSLRASPASMRTLKHPVSGAETDTVLEFFVARE
jgi:hypothetical protein